MSTIGVISDTHGLLHPEAVDALEGSDLIVHAGDVGRPEILADLSELAPVHAVRGNVDGGDWAEELPFTHAVEVGGEWLYVLHILDRLDLDPVGADFKAVIYGHTHRPSIEWRDEVLYFNPGSAGPKRFELPVSVGRLVVSNGRIEPELIELSV